MEYILTIKLKMVIEAKEKQEVKELFLANPSFYLKQAELVSEPVIEIKEKNENTPI